MKCRDANRMMTDSLAGELSEQQTQALEAHLAECEPCRKEFTEFKTFWAETESALQKPAGLLSLSPERKKQIFAQAENLKTPEPSTAFPVMFLKIAAMIMIGVAVIGIFLPPLFNRQDSSEKMSQIKEVKESQLQNPNASIDALQAAPASAAIASEEKLPAKRNMAIVENAMDEKELPKTAEKDSAIIGVAKTIKGRFAESKRKADTVIRIKAISAQTVKKFVPMKLEADKETAKQLLPSKTFNLDLKRWNIKTPDDLKKLLLAKKYPLPAEIILDKNKNTVTLYASSQQLQQLEKFFVALAEKPLTPTLKKAIDSNAQTKKNQ
ncbi:MAG: zf-HC2 domain-containing protein [Victivallaceae bacterium]